MRIAKLVAGGASNRSVASQLFLSPKTVETHVHAVFRKLGLDVSDDYNRRVLAVIAYLGRE